MDALVVRFEANDAETLDALADGDLPYPLRGGEARAESFRDVFYDTPDAELRRRGGVARLRVHADGSQTLRAEVRDAGHPARRAEATFAPSDPRELLAGLSGPVQMLRTVVDPARLEPVLEVATRRRVRPAVAEGDRGDEVRMEIECAIRTVREGELSADLYEVEVRSGGDDDEAREAVRRLEARFGLRPLPAGRHDRWRETLREAELDWAEDAVRAARRVAVVPWTGGRAGLLRRGGRLCLPTGPGSGAEAARRALRAVFGGEEGRLRLLGTGPGSPRQPATEVWLAEEMNDAAPLQSLGTLVHASLEELLSSVGSPALRDDATLAALHVLARAGLPPAPEAGSDEEARAALLSAPRYRAPEEEGAGDELPPGSLLNMELSVLAFNRRVLEMAGDERVPLLERARFLSIFAANMDEFFRVRVAAFKRQVAEGSEKPTLDGVGPREQLDAIGVRVRQLMDRAYRLLFDELSPALAKAKIEVVRPKDLRRPERAWLREYYDREVHALLTPLAAGPGHPFPHIRNQRPAIISVLREPLTGGERLGIVELPDGLPRFVPLDGKRRFIPQEAVIAANLHRLFPGMEVEAACTFRVTRSAELHLERVPVGDLLQAVEEEVRRRRFRPVVRVEVEDCMPERLRALLLRELQYEAPDQAPALGEEDVYEVEWLIDLSGLKELAAVERKGLHYTPEKAEEPLDADVPIVDVLRRREVLVRFPRDSFEATVERFVLEAADDPDVVAIKLALYRTNRRSRIVEALRRASARGKQVVALVELTARFDEERNVAWARYLRSSGIHVVHGIPGLKIHAKTALVVRREEGATRGYAYIGTGNLNAATAGAYTDLGLLTADPALADEVADLFNVLTGAWGEPSYHRLLVAPHNMRRRFVEMIERETEHALAGRGGHVVAKCNGLADREVIAALYRASRAGVKVELIVRSICALRPGVSGLSENIRVFSILGRYLEHGRIFRFENAGDPEYYIGSADWRTRNLSKRVEVAVPVRDPAHRAELDAILQQQLGYPDAWELGSDGTYYQRPEPAPRDPALPPPDPGRAPIITAGT